MLTFTLQRYYFSSIFPSCLLNHSLFCQFLTKQGDLSLSLHNLYPFTGGHATIRHELSELTFRKEKFQYVHQFYECDETKERFTTTALDEVNVGQVYNQYRAKYCIPFPDEIKRIRQRYGLSASKMSQILGFGDNQYRLYENGDMPSEANGKILMSIQNPHIFESFVLNAKNQFAEEDFAKILNKVKSVKTDAYGAFIKDYIFNGSRRDIFNGYATQSISKLRNSISSKQSTSVSSQTTPLRFLISATTKMHGRSTWIADR